MSNWMVQGEPQLNGQSICQDKVVLELGSGPGLCGFIAAWWAKQVILTDYQDIVMDLIEKNMQTCNKRPQEC
eukprot:CAMPEP_0116880380 /NCGR_PEP_ID=MMETSP0463-20121206/12292_1 /TAXON_ID=181622 /ORGANISM="Strombidinopsis sp, Strain SopsisLIS2011" /LENGTH=71 /DNA_ID=CAMNT_0004530867 /DNA_START=192 /DNA_END=407 /DNA_ORIENTATION=-